MKSKEEIEQRLLKLQSYFQDLLFEESQMKEWQGTRFFARPIKWIKEDQKEVKAQIKTLEWVLK